MSLISVHHPPLSSLAVEHGVNEQPAQIYDTVNGVMKNDLGGFQGFWMNESVRGRGWGTVRG